MGRVDFPKERKFYQPLESAIHPPSCQYMCACTHKLKVPAFALARSLTYTICNTITQAHSLNWPGINPKCPSEFLKCQEAANLRRPCSSNQSHQTLLTNPLVLPHVTTHEGSPQDLILSPNSSPFLRPQEHLQSSVSVSAHLQC